MTRKEKLIEKFKQVKGDRSLEEVRKILEIIGYRLTRIKGSHHIFRNDNKEGIAIPVHNNRVGQGYIKIIKHIINNNEKI